MAIIRTMHSSIVSVLLVLVALSSGTKGQVHDPSVSGAAHRTQTIQTELQYLSIQFNKGQDGDTNPVIMAASTEGAFTGWDLSTTTMRARAGMSKTTGVASVEIPMNRMLTFVRVFCSFPPSFC